jgi:hypothetical protein
MISVPKQHVLPLFSCIIAFLGLFVSMATYYTTEVKQADLDIQIGPLTEIYLFDDNSGVGISIAINVSNRARATGTIDRINLIVTNQNDLEKNYYFKNYSFSHLDENSSWKPEFMDSHFMNLPVAGTVSKQKVVWFHWDNYKMTDSRSQFKVSDGKHAFTLLIWMNGSPKPVKIYKHLEITTAQLGELERRRGSPANTVRLYFDRNFESVNNVIQKNDLKQYDVEIKFAN